MAATPMLADTLPALPEASVLGNELMHMEMSVCLRLLATGPMPHPYVLFAGMELFI